jgi:signal transduction histidine kinase
LGQHKAALGAFVTDDPRGQKIPEYLTKLAGAIDVERTRMFGELESLTKNIDHIKAIVSLQQTHAKAGGVVERLSLSQLLDDALKFNFAVRGISGVDIVRDYGVLGDVDLDRHKLLQVVMNLLSNAQHAVRDSDKAFKQISIRTLQMPGAMVAIEIEDNGIGIAAENLDRIFQHGFTTKTDGHGFGLHSAACAVTELKGSLAVRSDGRGRGAAFTILLPDSSQRAQVSA